LIKSAHIRFVFVLFLFALSCEKIPLVEADAFNLAGEDKQVLLKQEGVRSEQQYRHPSLSEEAYQGALNAVKKTYQLTDIAFTPLKPIANNIGTYLADSTYTGMIYSSVKEIGTYVGSNTSFHTFMTAIHNPRSKIYTDWINRKPYHGTNCRAYYGTVCSGLVSYALGLMPILGSYDFPVFDEMEELDITDTDVFHLADVLWRTGHVAIITDVIRDSKDRVVLLEVSESISSGCRKYTVKRGSIPGSIGNRYKKLLRYTHLEDNTAYIPAPEFVSVLDENPVPFVYNDDICTEKGDRSCYFVGETVTLNLLSPGDSVQVYKDGVLYSSIPVEAENIRLSDLDFGVYQARIFQGERNSDYTTWMMVDKTVVPSVDEMKVYFGSENSTPVSLLFCNKAGGRGYTVNESICRRFSEEEIVNGYMTIPSERMKEDLPYFTITFATEFGNIATTPIEWK
jgi:hypothetical protein